MKKKIAKWSRIGLRVRKENKKKLVEIAQKNDISVAKLIRDIIKKTCNL